MPVQPSATDFVETYTAFGTDSLDFFNESFLFAQDTLSQIISVEPPEPIRYEGIPRKETFASQSSVTLLLLVQFFLLAFSFQIIVKQVGSLLKSNSVALNFSHQKALFTSKEIMQWFLLLTFSCINLGFLFYILFTGEELLIWQNFLPIVFGFFILFLFKIAVLRLLGYVFFNKNMAAFWIQNNFSIYAFLNILIFPALIWVIYFQISDLFLLYTAAFAVIISFLALIYRLLIIFQIQIYSSFHIILYLCILEIAPILLLCFVLSKLQIFV